MPVIKLGTITLIVNGFSLNNGLPYFQKAAAEGLRNRLRKKSIKIRLCSEDGNDAIQFETHNICLTRLEI